MAARLVDSSGATQRHIRVHESQNTLPGRMLSSRTLIVAVCALFARAGVGAQATHGELQWVNGEWERYWRVLQVGGDVPEHPWSNRPFGPAELTRLHAFGDHPWAGRQMRKPFRFGRGEAARSPVDLQVIFNSAFPYGFNEGPVWAGRGATTVVRAGASFSFGPLSAAVSPVLFQAQNATFELFDNGAPGPYAFGFPYPWGADMPQRFGDRTYRRVDPGNSFIRMDAGPVAAGFSTAAQHWGPARDHPLVLGNNAGGFPHVFLGTARPTRVGPVLGHGKMTWGKLYQSRYTFMDEIARHRLTAGFVGLIVPVSVPGLELGAARFVHVLWSGDVLTRYNLLRPFGRLLGTQSTNPENQVASLFGRWVFPRGGMEAYGEFAREDGNLTFRHLTLEPDHAAGYMVGLQRVWGGAGRSIGDTARAASGVPNPASARRSVVRLEVLNTRSTSVHLIPSQTPFYAHSPISQGHTHIGRALGSAGAFGGGGASLAYDRYTSAGRWTASWSRLMRAEHLTTERGWVPIPLNADVFHAFGVDGVVFRGASAFTYELTGVYELNRNFQRDAFSLRAGSGVRFSW